MGFYVNLKTLNDDATDYSKKISSLIPDMQNSEHAMNKIITDGALYGSAGQAVADDINNNINAMLAGIKDQFVTVSSGYPADIKAFKKKVKEKSDSAILDEDEITKVKNKLKDLNPDHDQVVKDIQSVFDSVSDLISLSVPKSDFSDQCQKAHKFVGDIITDVNDFNTDKSPISGYQSLLTALNAYLMKANAAVKLPFTDPRIQDHYADDDFAKAVGKIDANVEDALEKAKKEQAKAKKAQDEWNKYHPVEAAWNWAKGKIGEGWTWVVEQTKNMPDWMNYMPSPLSSITGRGFKDSLLEAEGVVDAAGELVGGVISLGAMGLDNDVDEFYNATSLIQNGTIDKGATQAMNDKVTGLWNGIKSLGDLGNDWKMICSAVGGVYNDIVTGNSYNIGKDIFNIGVNFIPIGGEVKMGAEAAVDVGKLAAEGATKIAAKDLIKDGAETLAKDSLADLGKTGLKDTIQVTTKDFAKSTSESVAKFLDENMAVKFAREASEKLKDAAKVYVPNNLATEGVDLARGAGEKVVANTVRKDTVKDLSEDVAKQADLSRDVVKNSRKLAEDYRDKLGDLGKSHPTKSTYKIENKKFADKQGRPDWSQAPNGGFDMGKKIDTDAGSKINVGDTFDRFGAESGNYSSPKIDGKSFNYDSRSLPYEESSMEYHQYEWKVKPTSENISKALKDHPDILDDINTRLAKNGQEPLDVSDTKKLQIKQGDAAPAFGRGGGAIQMQLPFGIDDFKALNLIGDI